MSNVYFLNLDAQKTDLTGLEPMHMDESTLTHSEMQSLCRIRLLSLNEMEMDSCTHSPSAHSLPEELNTTAPSHKGDLHSESSHMMGHLLSS